MREKVWRSVFSGRMLSIFLLGISSGLPLVLVGQTLKFWMAKIGVKLTVIGYFTLVQAPYNLKFLWSPVLDYITPPFLGRRRGWILIMQACLIVSLCMLGLSNPAENPSWTALLALITAFFSATQDIAIDAYRREILDQRELGLGSAMGVNGYRIAMYIAGAGALALSDHFPWHIVYFCMAGVLVVAMIVTFWSPEPTAVAKPKTFGHAVVDPFLDYFRRPYALEILLFVLLYKLGDAMAQHNFNPFYASVNFTGTEIAAVAKTLGIWAMILGGTFGGALILRWGLLRCLVVFGILQSVAVYGFSILATHGHDLKVLAGAITLETFTSGMGTAAFIGLLSSLCNRKLAATQYALLSSLVTLPSLIFGSQTGKLAEVLGWSNYFFFCTLIGLPGLLMLFRYRKWEAGFPQEEPATS